MVEESENGNELYGEVVRTTNLHKSVRPRLSSSLSINKRVQFRAVFAEAVGGRAALSSAAGSLPHVRIEGRVSTHDDVVDPSAGQMQQP